jgi:hypothetical protein
MVLDPFGQHDPEGVYPGLDFYSMELRPRWLPEWVDHAFGIEYHRREPLSLDKHIGKASLVGTAQDSGHKVSALFFFNFFGRPIPDKWAFPPLMTSWFGWPLKHVRSEFDGPYPKEIVLTPDPDAHFYLRHGA